MGSFVPPVPPVIVLAYDGIAADEAGVVVEVVAGAGIDVVIASVEANPVTSYHGKVVPSRSATELVTSSAFVVPGGMGVRSATHDPRLLTAISALARGATWLGATSTGSVLLASSGAIDGARVTTHWLATDLIATEGAGVRLVDEPFVEDGRLLTASGLASTAALGFRLVGALAGVEAEAAARARYRPRRPGGPRYGPRQPWWRTVGRRRVSLMSPAGHPLLDPAGNAEIIVLDVEPVNC